MQKMSLKESLLNSKNLMPLKLQLFAEGDDLGADPGGDGGTGELGGGDPGSNDAGVGEPLSFASEAERDSYLDKRTAKAIETAKIKWEAEKATAIQAAKTEAEKMAEMTAEQKAQHKEQERLDEISKREADITRRELRAQSLEKLAEKELPKELIDVVVFTDAESCNASIEAIEKAFRKSVEDGVNKRLAQSADVPGSGGSSTKLSIGETMAKQLNEQTKPADKSLWD